MLMKGSTQFEEILSRLGEAFCIDGKLTQVKLAEALEIRQSSISDAKNRCGRDKRYPVPAEWLLKALEFGGVDPNWIVTGEEPKYRVLSDDGEGALTVTEVRKKVAEEYQRPLSFEELLEELNSRLPDGANLRIDYPRSKSFTERYLEASQIVVEQQEDHNA
ncbi:helix-turn-helix domain-containing protein [Maridesulfovibrio sp.]|uniref:helix-turn-helix domain-containing protein n=1 Tax=Maridesulfovibrio sp. TaxID=2795000 RepID=UPI002AA6FCDB|nr:helix-turn-helix domain-containing protein [Maridesulfovibrio sp.]